MAVPQFTYNSKTITLPRQARTRQVDAPGLVLRNEAASGTCEYLNVSAGEYIAVLMNGMVNGDSTHQTLRRNLEQWYQWARLGEDWTFALDSTNKILTTLANGEPAGDTVIVLGSTTGIVAGRQYVVKTKTHQDLVKVASVDSSTQVTLTESLNVAFAAGARFRSQYYWPGKLIDSRNPIQELGQAHWDFQLFFKEEVNSLAA